MVVDVIILQHSMAVVIEVHADLRKDINSSPFDKSNADHDKNNIKVRHHEPMTTLTIPAFGKRLGPEVVCRRRT